MGYYVYLALILLDGWIIKSSDSSGSELNRERYNSHNWIRMTRLADNLGLRVDGPPPSMPSKFLNKIKLFCCFWELWNFTIFSDLFGPPPPILNSSNWTNECINNLNQFIHNDTDSISYENWCQFIIVQKWWHGEIQISVSYDMCLDTW